MLVVHAVIGGHHQHAAEPVELPGIFVHHGVEGIREIGAGRGLVLHIIRGRQIHQVRPLALEDRNAGRHHEFGQIRRIDFRQFHADAIQHIADAVFFHIGLVGLFRGERDGAAARHVEAVAEHGAQLVLRGHHRDLGAGIVERLHDGRRAQEFRVVHHHFGLGRRIVEIIAGDAVHGRRAAGDDRHVVRIGEARDDGMRQQIGAVFHHPRHIRRQPLLDRALDIAGLRSVDADDDGRRFRKPVRAAVAGDVGSDAAVIHAMLPRLAVNVTALRLSF